MQDSYSKFNDKDPRGLKIEDLLASLKKLQISYNFGKINDTTDVMLREFRNLYPIREINLDKPGDLFMVTILSISKVVGSTLKSILNEKKVELKGEDGKGKGKNILGKKDQVKGRLRLMLF